MNDILDIRSEAAQNARMADEPTLTSESGAPVTDNQNSQIAGPGGPTLLQDHYLIEKLARFNRERIPERVVHAVGSGAYGYLEVTSPEVPKWTKMKVFEQVGKRTDMFIDDFKQAGDLYRLQPADAQQRLVDNIAGSLAQVSRDDIIERSIGHFRRADETFGQRIADGVAARRGVLAGASA
jgi:catalase